MRARKVLECLCVLGTATAPALFAMPAAAEDLAIDRFQPAPAGDRLFGVPSPYAAGLTTPHLALIGEYAHEPVVLETDVGDDRIGAIVSGQFLLHVNGTLALANRVAANVDLPFALVNTGESPTADGATFTSPSGAAAGDLRLGIRFTLVGAYYDPVQVAIGGYMWMPTGASGAFMSDGTVRGQPHLVFGGRTDRVVWSLAVGPELRRSQSFLQAGQGPRMQGGAGVGFLLDDERNFQLGPETYFSAVLDDDAVGTTNGELLIGAKYRFARFMEAGLAAGPGLTNGIGTPAVRAVASLAYTPEVPRKVAPGDRDKDGVLDPDDACPLVPGVRSVDKKKNGCPLPLDTDGDGIVDPEDACPKLAGIKTEDPLTNGCPPPGDKDDDGIPDDKDACPLEPGVANADAKKHGCPPDKDGDGVPDKFDACPDIPGVKTDDPTTNGCPPDTDGDGIRDDVDACPREKGVKDADPKKHGCPKDVRATDDQIVLLRQIEFDFDKASIRPNSFELIDQIAQVLRDHPEITKVEVQGHTDRRGTHERNMKLSQERAEAVVAALVQRGIDASRLQAKGYGFSVPIATNTTDEGRQRNRRVQLRIVETGGKPPASGKQEPGGKQEPEGMQQPGGKK